MSELRMRRGAGARGLEFAILTAARTGEVIGARWEEVDVGNRVWTIEASRTKRRREHRVPLSDATIGIIEEVRGIIPSDYLFPGHLANRPLSNMAFLALLRRMGRSDYTVHGFRSTFRDWVSERTAFPGEVAEMALGHSISGRVEAAYRRGDLFEKRRKLMDAWASFCAFTTPADTGTGKIVGLRGGLSSAASK